MAEPDHGERPKNTEVEHENLRPPRTAGEPPRPATEPPGSAASQSGGKTGVDPGSGEPQRKPH